LLVNLLVNLLVFLEGVIITRGGGRIITNFDAKFCDAWDEWQSKASYVRVWSYIPMFPSIYFRISRDLTRVLYFFVSIFLCFPRRRARSTLSALRLSKLSRRHETRLSRRSQILPFCFFLSSSRQSGLSGQKLSKGHTAGGHTRTVL